MGLPVPVIHQYKREKGWFIMEDLGDLSLQKASLSSNTPAAVQDLYGPILDLLVSFQQRAVHGFQAAWSYQGATYDQRLMLDMESGYFLRAFLRGYLGWSGDESALLNEFQGLARYAAEAPIGFIIHRDFQSRNVLLPQIGNPYLIDFQGARRGPLQYDVAALVIDPYVEISSRARQAILSGYLDRLDASGLLEPGAFMDHYPVIALHRNLQILGAFAFLGTEKGKSFFLQWIKPALSRLRDLLENHTSLKCPQLREHVERAYDKIQEPGVT
jgi:aminoglycoside/choline kinase family phosphotransferase